VVVAAFALKPADTSKLSVGAATAEPAQSRLNSATTVKFMVRLSWLFFMQQLFIAKKIAAIDQGKDSSVPQAR
jgi:hypothetical protein